jgi:hypothetical protein
MFTTDRERAAAYAVCKTLERMLSQNGSLPAGFSMDLSGTSVTVVLPPDSVVERDAGTAGDGTIMKIAVQNLYGYALWALMIRRLRRFNQWKAIREMIVDAMIEVVRNPSKNARDEIVKNDPEVADEIERIRAEVDIPARVEDTPRVYRSPKLPATVKFAFKK